MDYTGKDNIEVEGHIGTWYTIDTTTIKDKQFFLLEHEEYGDETSALIIDAEGKLILADVWNGFDDLDEHFDYLAMKGINNGIDEHIAYKMSEFYLYVQSVDDGFDYTIYDKNLNSLDGGVYDDPTITMSEAVSIIKEDLGSDIKSLQLSVAEPIDVTEFLSKVEIAEEQQTTTKFLDKHFEENTKNAYAIYQLKDNDHTRGFRFEGIAHLERNDIEVDKSNYNNIYTDSVADVLQQADKTDILNHLYEKFNVDRPTDFKGHSLSVGDVVALKIDGEISPHFVDSFGFKEVPFFDTKKLEMEMSAEPTTKGFLSDLMIEIKDNSQTVVDSLINNLDTRDKLSNIIALCDLKQELYEVHSFDDVVSLQGFCKDLSYKYEEHPLETITDFAVKAINNNMPIADLFDMKRSVFMSALLDNDTESLINPLETAEKSLEQNYNQIDGVINNEPTVKREKPSILEALKKDKAITEKPIDTKPKDLER